MFNEYPKIMNHPQFQAAVYVKMEGKGKGLFEPDTVMKSPERWPPVTVTNLTQEKQYAAKGYRPANMANAKEYEAAILEGSPTEGYAFQEYPKFKYHPNDLPRVVNNRDEEKALGKGWFDVPCNTVEDLT